MRWKIGCWEMILSLWARLRLLKWTWKHYWINWMKLIKAVTQYAYTIAQCTYILACARTNTHNHRFKWDGDVMTLWECTHTFEDLFINIYTVTQTHAQQNRFIISKEIITALHVRIEVKSCKCWRFLWNMWEVRIYTFVLRIQMFKDIKIQFDTLISIVTRHSNIYTHVWCVI